MHLHQRFDTEPVGVGTETADDTATGGTDERSMPEGFALVDVADMYLHHRDGGNGTYGIVEGNGSVGIGTGIEDDAVATFAPCLLETVDEGTLVVRLETVDLDSPRCIPVAQML